MEKESNKNSEQYTQICLQNDIGEASIHMLNNDCLTHIFQFLPIIDRVRIERVCKRWRDLSQNSWYAMKRLDLLKSTWGLDTHEISANKFRKILLKCGRFLTQIDCSEALHWAMKEPENVESKRLDETILSIIGKLCPNLTNIDITPLKMYESDIRILAQNWRNIKKLKLGYIRKLDFELKNFFKLNQNLEYLAIHEGRVSVKALLYLPEQIHTIILSNCHCSDNDFFPMALQRLKNLKHLTTNNCVKNKMVEQRILEVIGNHCKNLTVLELRLYIFMGRTDLLHITHLVNLQVFKVTYSLVIKDEFLANLVKRCQQLVSLDITGCRFISNNGLNAIAALPKLEKLIINYINANITDRGLLNMSNLKELECRKCPFSDQGISMFIKSSLRLELIDLSGCRDITEFTLKAAKDACDTRSNNVMLKMIVGRTSINRKILRKYCITDRDLLNTFDLKELAYRKRLHCTYIDIPFSFNELAIHLEFLHSARCECVTEFTLEAAKDTCDTRSNNVMLKMIKAGTTIKRKIFQKYVISPLLQIVNIDLSYTY